LELVAPPVTASWLSCLLSGSVTASATTSVAVIYK